MEDEIKELIGKWLVRRQDASDGLSYAVANSSPETAAECRAWLAASREIISDLREIVANENRCGV